jgi:hypothetical protein
MFGIDRNTWRTLRALAVLILVTSAAMSSSTSTRAAAANDAISHSASADPDAATAWHNIAVQALVAASPARPNPIPFLDLAVVQVAIHDAVQAIDRRFTPYHVISPAEPPAHVRPPPPRPHTIYWSRSCRARRLRSTRRTTTA